MVAATEASILRKLDWAILPILCIMIGCCYLDRSNIAYMQLQLRRAPPVGLSFGPSLYGNASGLFFLSYSLLQIPSTLVVARVGAPVWLAATVALWGVAAAALAAVRGPAEFLVLRVLLGIFEAGTFPGMWYHMLLFYPVKDFTVPLAATSSSIMLAQVLSAPLAAALMSLHGAAGLQGWQWIALAEGAATVAVGAVLVCVLPHTPADVKALSEEEVSWVRSRVSKPATAGELMHGLRYAATSRALWLLTAVLTAKSFAVFSLIFWIPLVVSDLLNRWSSGGAATTALPAAAADIGGEGTAHDMTAVLLTTVPYAFAAAAAYLLGWSSQVRGERRAHTYVPFAIAAAVLLAAPLLQGPEMAVPAFVALTIALSLANSTAPVTAAVPACLPPEAQAGGLALYNSVSGIGGYFGPAAFGWLKEATGSNAPGMVVMGLVLLAGAALIWAFDEEAAAAQAHHGMRASEDAAATALVKPPEAPGHASPLLAAADVAPLLRHAGHAESSMEFQATSSARDDVSLDAS